MPSSSNNDSFDVINVLVGIFTDSSDLKYNVLPILEFSVLNAPVTVPFPMFEISVEPCLVSMASILSLSTFPTASSKALLPDSVDNKLVDNTVSKSVISAILPENAMFLISANVLTILPTMSFILSLGDIGVLSFTSSIVSTLDSDISSILIALLPMYSHIPSIYIYSSYTLFDSGLVEGTKYSVFSSPVSGKLVTIL